VDAAEQKISREADDDGGDSALGNLIADAQKADATIDDAGEPVIALMNPGGIRADLVENADGDITYGAAFSVQPFNNLVTSMELTGAELKAILNQQWNDRNEGAPKILQVSGLSYTWDESLAAEEGADALVDLVVDHDGDATTPMVPVVDAATYRVAMNNFIADGGDGFTLIPESADNRVTGGLDIDSLVEYLKAHDPVSPTPTDRISQQP